MANTYTPTSNREELPEGFLPKGMSYELNLLNRDITLCWDGFYYRIDMGTFNEMRHNRVMYDRMMERIYSDKREYERRRMENACTPRMYLDDAPVKKFAEVEKAPKPYKNGEAPVDQRKILLLIQRSKQK